MHSRRKSKRPRYRVIGGIPSVELKLRTPRQLFDERDPAPFRERDLDDDAVEYIVSSVRELKEQRDVRLSLYFETLGEFENNPGDIARAIHQFFRYEADMKRRSLREAFRHGLFSLVIGLALFTLFVWTAHSPDASAKLPLGEAMFYEGIHLLGWVSMWTPISFFLYEWWPIADELAVLKRYDLAMDGIRHEPDPKEQKKLERRKKANRKYRARMLDALNRIRWEKKAKAKCNQ